MTDCVCSRNEHTYQHSLHLSASHGCTSCLQIAIVNSADVNMKYHFGDIPLHKASRSLHPKIVRQLLASKSFVDVKNRYGCTPLFLAAVYSTNDDGVNIIKMLLDNGARAEKAAFISLDTKWARLVYRLSNGRNMCRRTVIAFLGMRHELNSIKDTHQMIGKLLWSSRFDQSWDKIIEESSEKN